MRRKLLAMDLDGTAVTDDYILRPSAVRAIEEARKHGLRTAFVSGRRDVDMLTLGEEQWCVDYHILNNGGKIIRCADRKILKNDCIDQSTSIRLIRYALENELQLHIVSGMRWQVTRMSESTLRYAKLLGVIPGTVCSLEEIDTEAIEGFMATGDLQPVAEYIDRELPELCYLHSEPGTIDIMRRGVSKWNGIRALADLLGIAESETAAAGNYYNDLDMIEKAGLGIAVANAVGPVKEAAAYVTKNDNNHDAVEEMIGYILREVEENE
ncbi:MAG: Cof-type HAD-IIB family hydrolase [Erysipelotrichaceae bacterium]|nr:Cof-type HAD-IIB family hydrolase [Erysipelotrichaceae bacterium]MBR3151789.1 Cof-type HAD-IIB family hydrolase [Erysipelotrichaceae bacterium]